MPNPTRQEIIDAHNALDEMLQRILRINGRWSSKERDQILAALPPKPQPTMDEVEWDDDKHYLAEAEHSAWGKVIMLSESRLSETIRILANSGYSKYVKTVNSGDLTPTGRRYTLTEVQE